MNPNIITLLKVPDTNNLELAHQLAIGQGELEELKKYIHEELSKLLKKKRAISSILKRDLRRDSKKIRKKISLLRFYDLRISRFYDFYDSINES